jgi:CheY-like chemotaxis protein
VTSVLVVDDEPDIALICRLALTLAGYDVDERDTGQGAVEYLLDETPDVVLLDLRLPDLSGWEVLDTLREKGRLDDLRVILFSAHASAEESALQAGCVSFVSKPFTPDDLVAHVAAAAALPRPRAGS